MVKLGLMNFPVAISLISMKTPESGLQNPTSLLSMWLVAGKDVRQSLLS